MTQPQLLGHDNHLNRDVILAVPDRLDPEFQKPRATRQFACLCIPDGRGIDDSSIRKFCRALIRLGCAYLCCWGPDWERVHDLMDSECADGGNPPEPDIGCLMTTWQANENLEHAVDFLLSRTHADENYVPAGCDRNLADGVKKNLATTIEETGANLAAPPLPTIYADPVPMTHLFQNLLSNALKYRGDQVPDIQISVEKQSDFWRFSVKDNGIGIPAEFQSQIFGMFKRLHDRRTYPGTGIGLAICQKIVEGYGGRIWVESEFGQGSTFFFTLPTETAR